MADQAAGPAVEDDHSDWSGETLPLNGCWNGDATAHAAAGGAPIAAQGLDPAKPAGLAQEHGHMPTGIVAPGWLGAEQAHTASRARCKCEPHPCCRDGSAVTHNRKRGNLHLACVADAGAQTRVSSFPIGTPWHMRGQQRFPLCDIGDEASIIYDKTTADLGSPIIFKVTTDGAKVDPAVDAWLAQSVAHCEKERLRRTVAPATAAHGAEQLRVFMAATQPPNTTAPFGCEALRERVRESRWCTEMPGFCECGWQWQALGLLRYQLVGVSELIAVSGTAWEANAPGLIGSMADALAFEKWLCGTNSADPFERMQPKTADLDLFCGTLSPGHVLLLPQGFLLATRTPIEGGATASIARSFLHPGDNAYSNMSAVARLESGLPRMKLEELLVAMLATLGVQKKASAASHATGSAGQTD